LVKAMFRLNGDEETSDLERDYDLLIETAPGFAPTAGPSAGPGSSTSGSDEGDGDGETRRETGQEAGVATRERLKEPRRFACLLHNDDYTTMEFVIEVLTRYFHKTGAEATQIMLHVHNDGKGVAGIYPFDIAETKASQVEELARERNYPLKCTIEPA
jgi:ATP-dependent Clp protease adaptor protein ClpS